MKYYIVCRRRYSQCYGLDAIGFFWRQQGELDHKFMDAAELSLSGQEGCSQDQAPYDRVMSRRYRESVLEHTDPRTAVVSFIFRCQLCYCRIHFNVKTWARNSGPQGRVVVEGGLGYCFSNPALEKPHIVWALFVGGPITSVWLLDRIAFPVLLDPS